MRKKLIVWLFEKSQKIYTKFKKKKPWNISRDELLTYPKNTFGYHLGSFLTKNGFELLPKVERHDAYHVLTNYSTQVQDEIALQYLCFGNGKRSPNLFGVVIVGTLLLPDYLTYYIESYKLGKNCNTFHHFNYKNLLNDDFEELRSIIFTKHQILNTIK